MWLTRLPGFACLILSLFGVCRGQIHTLDPGVDLNGAVNPGPAILVDWEGDGGIDLVAVDSLKRQLVRVPLQLGEDPGMDLPVVRFHSLPARGRIRLLRGPLDDNPGHELVLIHEARALVWSSGERADSPGGAPDRVLPLPDRTANYFGGAALEDFDRDGRADLFLGGPTFEQFDAGEPYDPGVVIFSIGRSDEAVVDLPAFDSEFARPRIGPSWETGGPRSILVKRTAYRFTNDRELVLIPGTDQVSDFSRPYADLDGDGVPERMSLGFEVDDPSDPYSVSSFLRVQEVAEQEGEAIARFSLGQRVVERPVIELSADFDGDGRDEVLVAFREIFPATEDTMWLLAANDQSGEIELTPHALGEELLPDGSVSAYPSTGLSTLALPDGSGYLLRRHLLEPSVTDLLGNPTSLSGSGTRTTVWTKPADPMEPGELELRFHHAPSAIGVAPFDPGSSPDLAVLRSGSWLDLRTGPIPESGPLEAAGSVWPPAEGSLHLVDLSGDGIADPVLGTSGGIEWERTVTWSSGTEFRYGDQILEFEGEPVAPFRVLGDADFDGDGDTDLLVLHGGEGQIGWCENDTESQWTFHGISLAGRVIPPNSGHFLGGTTFPATRWPDQVNTIIRDVDGDGDPDIVSIPSALGNRVTLHRNTPVGFTLEPLTPALHELPEAGGPEGMSADLRLGNFHGEGVEIAILSGSGSDELGSPEGKVWRLVSGSKPMMPGPPTSLEWPIVRSTEVVDFDGDGLDDMILAGGFGTDLLGNPVGSSGLFWLRGKRGGEWAHPVKLATPLGLVDSLRSADLDENGLPDLISASEATGTLEVFMHRTREALPSFDEWGAARVPADAGSEADPDGDGVANAIEYLYGTDPNDASSSRPERGTAGFDYHRHLEIPSGAYVVRPRASDGPPMEVTLETTSDFLDWEPVNDAPDILVDPDAPLVETLKWSIKYEGREARFYRFRVRPGRSN